MALKVIDSFGPKLYKRFAILYEVFLLVKYPCIISNIKRSVGFVFNSDSIKFLDLQMCFRFHEFYSQHSFHF
jgi:hypothetical protein